MDTGSDARTGRPWATAPLTIGQLAHRSGVAPSALRYYEERGLLTARRNEAGHRRYPRATLRRVAFIVFAQRIGLTLEEIRRELACLPENRVPTRADWASLSKGWRRRIDERIAELRRLRDSLGECIGCGCLSLDRCRMANPEDGAGRRGPGARYWLGDPREGRRAGSNNSIGLPSGSSIWICLPPGPTSI